MRTIRLATILGPLGTAALLGLLSATAGLGAAGWITGLAAGTAASVLLAAARRRSDEPEIHPADWVTLTRAVLIAGVAGLVADSFGRSISITALVTLSAVALVLDAVDGQVARRTGTATALGARIDGEVDAFLILLLSIIVSGEYGSWVLVIGAARYVLLIAGWLVPWLAATLPPRYWRKVVAAVQGIVLTVAASGVLLHVIGTIALLVALALLAESFGRDVVWLYRAGAGPRSRQVLGAAVTVAAVALVWGDLLVPDKPWQFTPAAFVRIPVEALVLVAIGLVLPPMARRIVAAFAGILMGLFTVARILDMAFYEEIDRPFNPVHDWGSIAPAVGVIRNAIGPTRTNLAIAGFWLGLILLVAAITASTIRITSVAAAHRRGAIRGLVAVVAVWGLAAGLSWQVTPGFPVASTSAAGLAVAQVKATDDAITDSRRFQQAVNGYDPESTVPAADLLTNLRGKDVVIAFVESYGQVAVQGSSFSPGVDTVLRNGTASLASAGWSTQSAWLTSPTFGGISWLAHSTLQSGLWVDSPQRYSQVTQSNRFTLSDAFKKAGWHTVSDIPSDEYTWAAGTFFYHWDQFYDRTDVGYHGPTFSYASMPDQYTLAEFQRLELQPGHSPVFSEIDLVSSHTPWAPLPTMVPWNQVGDGSIFDAQPSQSESAALVWRSADTVRQFFGQSIQYSLTALTSWVTELNDPNLVLILLGDHQPSIQVSGVGASHNVPISIVAKDPSVFQAIASWNWQDGLLPSPSAPLEPMDAFRNQFLNAFGSTPSGAAAAAGGSGAGAAAAGSSK